MSDVPPPDTAAVSAAQPGISPDPYRAYNFKLLVEGVVQGHFTRIDGLGVKIDRILYREGGEHATVRTVPGRVSYSEVTLRYGMTASTELWSWLLAAMEGNVERRHASISVLDASGTDEVRRWDLIDAWPCEWLGAPLDVLSREVAIESLTLAYDRLVLQDAAQPSSPGALA